jgi:hypothetical protein
MRDHTDAAPLVQPEHLAVPLAVDSETSVPARDEYSPAIGNSSEARHRHTMLS